ncbi:hypothetical protein GGF31_002492 [Allomyces arbusculus]|nr:hypothetical protein GGF31_002492 [Allomyces arbusculus]
MSALGFRNVPAAEAYPVVDDGMHVQCEQGGCRASGKDNVGGYVDPSILFPKTDAFLAARESSGSPIPPRWTPPVDEPATNDHGMPALIRLRAPRPVDVVTERHD